MAAFLDRVAAERKKTTRPVKAWSEPPSWSSDGLLAPLLSTYALTPDREPIENNFEAYVQDAYKANGIVFACVAARQRVFSQARFQWRTYTNGRPGPFTGSTDLSLLEKPWPNGTTGELLSRMEAMASLAGNSYETTADDSGNLGNAATGSGRRIVSLRPDWVTIVIGSNSGDPNAPDARILGFLYEPRATGGNTKSRPTFLLPSEVSHYSPTPDPGAKFRGMSWLTPIIREVQADKAATRHKGKFFDNGATPNMVVRFDKDVQKEQFDEFRAKFNEAHQGVENAYRTLFLAGGADVTVVGADFRQMDFAATQGKGENRIAVVAGVPAAILGISEGLQGSTLNAGNFGASRRLFVDSTIRDLWAKAAPSLRTLLPARTDRALLEVDDRNIPFLREDEKDAAEILQTKMLAIEAGVRSGFDPKSVVEAIASGDLLAMTHTGLVSVQLLPPGTTSPGDSGLPTDPEGGE